MGWKWKLLCLAILITVSGMSPQAAECRSRRYKFKVQCNRCNSPPTPLPRRYPATHVTEPGSFIQHAPFATPRNTRAYGAIKYEVDQNGWLTSPPPSTEASAMKAIAVIITVVFISTAAALIRIICCGKHGDPERPNCEEGDPSRIVVCNPTFALFACP